MAIMNKLNFIFVFWFFQLFSFCHAQAETNTEPDSSRPINSIRLFHNDKTVATIWATTAEIGYSIEDIRNGRVEDTEIKYGKIKLDNDENSIEYAIVVDDFDFNGNLDFAVEVSAAAMVPFFTYRVFVYSEEKRDFVEQFPADGGDFVYLAIDKEKRQLISMCHKSDAPGGCVTKLKEMK
jgi:hypothetical protein